MSDRAAATAQVVSFINARLDEERPLRRIASHVAGVRKRVEAHSTVDTWFHLADSDEVGSCETCSHIDWDERVLVPAPCPVLLDTAARWRRHPNYVTLFAGHGEKGSTA